MQVTDIPTINRPGHGHSLDFSEALAELELADGSNPAATVLLGIHDEQHVLIGMVRQLLDRLDQVEAEFGPLARKYSRVVAATEKLPGVGMRRARAATREDHP